MRNAIRNVVALVLAFGVLCVPCAVIRVSYDVAYVGASPEIEQLRSDMIGLSGAASEDVLGQATQWNQRIRRMQAYNARWWGDPFIPDAWDQVAVLPIPHEQ
jgi:hypothetical protein